MSTSEGLSTDSSGDSRSHQWRLVVDGNVAYHITHNAGKSWKIQEKVRAPGFEPWGVASHWTVLPLDYKPNHSPETFLPTPDAGPSPSSKETSRPLLRWLGRRPRWFALEKLLDDLTIFGAWKDEEPTKSQ
jgi:hypothetical protein